MIYMINIALVMITLYAPLAYSINIAVVSIPKCGTHLLTKCITQLTGKEPALIDCGRLPVLEDDNQFFYVHRIYNQEDAQALLRKHFHCFFIYRDPRDQIISLIFWIKHNPTLYPQLSQLTFDQLFKLILIEGVTERPVWGSGGLINIYKSFSPWKNVSNFYTLRFEDLVGPLGGGSLESQTREIKNIARHCGVALSPKLLKYCIKHLFGNRTFREGQIGSWKKHFDEWHKKIFKENAGNLLIDLGYETDLDW